MAKIWTREEVADIFGVTVSSIQNKVRRMKLTRKPNKNIRFFKDIDTEEKHIDLDLYMLMVMLFIIKNKVVKIL